MPTLKIPPAVIRMFIAALLLAGLGTARPALALDATVVHKLAFGDTSDDKIAAINALVESGDEQAEPLLKALLAGNVQTSGDRVLIIQGKAATDAVSGEKISPVPADASDVVLNNRIRGVLDSAVSALRLVSPDRATRLKAARELADDPRAAALPVVDKALARETDPEVKSVLEIVAASVHLHSGSEAERLAAIRTLAGSGNSKTESLLLPLVAKKADGSWAEPDAQIRAAAQKSLADVRGRLAWGERIGLLFAGLSLGSILMIAALGLAITYGLMGVINMAHGELIMLGAYATYVVQNLFRAYAPGAFDWYLVAAVPASFIVSGIAGMILERTVIRWLYGRPLETLLATWGISLILMQGVRSLFGAPNVQVTNPSWMSGGVQVMSNLVLPYSRIVIILFAAAVVAGIWLLLTRTRLGLFVRGVTQNRAMASCVGVPTARVDTLAFGLGCAIAGLAGCALSQIGNVGPALGQGYIVDSFMVVVLGGVGQLAGTVYAGMGLGLVDKLIESWSGAVIAKIAVLVFIIIFIQKRPQGLFALKGRAVEA
ncbi:MAG TPA: urea ABC transporter permease subunit UrtB [Burkholderiales bacterium]|nr:urea ABC transporter permease subunit UrtB [Burkholderiales bacterium]